MGGQYPRHRAGGSRTGPALASVTAGEVPSPPVTPAASARPARSIVRRLMVALTASIAVASVGAVLGLAMLDTRRQGAELELAADAAVRELARVAEPALWDLDMERAAQIGAAFAEDPRVVRLVIRENTTGEVRAVNHGPLVDTIARVANVERNGRLIGTVELTFTRAPLRRAVREQGVSALRASLVALVVAFLVVRLLVRRLLDAPLDELAASVAAYDDGRAAAMPAASSYEEFETLYEVLHAMRTRIAHQLGELQGANLRLTSEVESHQRTEEALRRSRNIEIKVINSVPQAVFWKDLDGRYLGANVVFAAGIGAGTPDRVVGRTDFELPRFTDLASRFRALDQRAVERLEPVRTIVDYVGDDGETRWVDTTRVPLVDSSERVFGVLGVSEDITERMRADEALLRRNRELASLNRFLDLAATDVPADFLIRRATEELISALQLPFGLAVLAEGRSALRVLLPAGADAASPLANRVMTPSEFPLALELGANRAPVVVRDMASDPRAGVLAPRARALGVRSLAAFPLMVEREVIGALLVGTREPHAFSEAEVALSMGIATQAASAIARYRANAAQRLLRAAIEQSPDSVLITDTEGVIVYANEAFSRVTGYTPEQALGATPRLLRSGAHPASFYAAIWEALRRGETWRGRITNRRADGTEIVQDAIIAPVRDDAGTITNYIANESDITQELAREERFRHAQRMDAVGQLAGGIAHDFNNILGAINLELELLELEQALPAEVARVVRDVRSSAQRAANLTRQLLMFSRRQVMTMRPHDLNVVVDDLLRMLTRVIGEQVTIDFRAAAEPAVFEGDAGMIEQVVMNLCVNARDAMPGGGTLGVSIDRVDVGAGDVPDTEDAAPGRYVRLRISDTGTGMSADTLGRLFEPFFTTKDVGKGTGLGLATAHGLVAQHHGFIAVDTALGQGSTFSVYLPAVTSPAAPADPVPEPPRAATTAATVLLVEDEEAVRKVIGRTLRRLGYQVLEASMGTEALEVWAASAPGTIQLLLTDMVMPERMSGLDLALRLRSADPELKVVIMSGYDVRLVGDNAGLINDVDFLGKPFSIGALGEMVTRLLGGPPVGAAKGGPGG